MKPMRRALSLLLSIPLVLLSVGCQQGDGNAPLKVRKVVYRKIVSLSPSTTEILAQPLGVTLAGRSAADNFPTNSLNNVPVVGGVKPDYEKLASIQPDLIVYDGSLYNEDDQKKLKSVGASVYVFDVKSMADFRAQIFELGSLVGQESHASDYLQRVKIELNNAKAKPPTPTPKVAIVLPGSSGSNMIVGTQSFLADIVRTIGGNPVGPDGARFTEMNPEALVSLDPDRIVVSGTAADHSGYDAFIKDPRFKTLKAVKNNAITIIDSDVLLRTGSRVDSLIKALYRAVSAK